MESEYDPTWMDQGKPVIKNPVTYSNLMRRAERQIAHIFGPEGPHQRTVRLHWVSHWTTSHSGGLVRVECILFHGIRHEVIERAVAQGDMRPVHAMTFGLALLFDPANKSLCMQMRFVTSAGVPMIYEKRMEGAGVSVEEKVEEIILYLIFLRTVIHVYDLCQALQMILPSRYNVALDFPKRPDPSAPLDTLWYIRVYGPEFSLPGLAFSIHMVKAQRVDNQFIFFHSQGGAKHVVARTDATSNFNTHFYAIYSTILRLSEELCLLAKSGGGGGETLLA